MTSHDHAAFVEGCFRCDLSREEARAGGVMTTVPNKPKTPLHSFRCPDELWKAAQAKAAERGENWSEELRKMVERYVKRR